VLALGVFALGLWLIGSRVTSTLRWGCGESVLWFADRTCQRCGWPTASRTAVLAPIAPLAAGIRMGRVSVNQGLEVIRAFDRGPVFVAIFLTMLQERLWEALDEPSPSDRVFLETRIAEFFTAWKQGRLPAERLGLLTSVAMENREMATRLRSGLVVQEPARLLKTRLDRAETIRCGELLALPATVTADLGPVSPPDAPAEATRLAIAVMGLSSGISSGNGP
jgi:hypothetical protein